MNLQIALDSECIIESIIPKLAETMLPGLQRASRVSLLGSPFQLGPKGVRRSPINHRSPGSWSASDGRPRQQ